MAEVCSDCGAYVASAAELVEHVKTAHGQVRSEESLATNAESHVPGYQCSLCGRRFASPQELAAHTLRPHPAPRHVGRPTPG
jgi:hypothetical protein